MLKSKGLQNIERMMEVVDTDSIRFQVLESAKQFKTSWVELGQVLYAVWKDKLYKAWGYQKFEAYTAKEIGVRRETAIKLVKSYWFLEREAPEYLKEDYTRSAEAARVPKLDSVNVLRLARDKDLHPEEYDRLKHNVLQKGAEPSAVKKELTELIRQREELEPDEARKQKKMVVVKRFLSQLKTLRKDLSLLKLLPEPLLKEADALIMKIETEVK
jgi:hypothetical protein